MLSVGLHLNNLPPDSQRMLLLISHSPALLADLLLLYEPKRSPSTFKLLLGHTFSKDICRVDICVNFNNLQLAFFNHITNKMSMHINMFRMSLRGMVMSHKNGIVTMTKHNIIALLVLHFTKQSLQLDHFSCTFRKSQILSLYKRKGNRTLQPRGLTNGSSNKHEDITSSRPPFF